MLFKDIVSEFKAEMKIISKTRLSKNGYTKELEDEIKTSIKELENGEFSTYKSIDELKKIFYEI